MRNSKPYSAQEVRAMPSRSFADSKFLIIPVLFTGLYVLGFFAASGAIDHKLPKWYTLAILGIMIVLERVYTYRYAVSQKHVLARDILSSFVNIYVSAAITSVLLLPVLVPVLQNILGRKLPLASSQQLGPIWFQVLAIFL